MDENFQNQLSEEKSGYLLKHAENPINWQSWDEEAFRDSVRFDKPIFLSIGYSACHYCHVMQRESFSDQEVADVFNRAFICIKVDSEELVTVDRKYMKFAEALMNGSGGWPLNLFLTPSRMPFFAVTYLPKRSSQGLMGMVELGEHIEGVWKSEERELLYEHANSVVDFFRDQAVYKSGDLFDEGDVHRAIADFFDGVDPLFGGMKGDPKFILNYELETLMQYGSSREEGRCEYFVRLTLDKMRDGGVYDQICGGFSRYATDPMWKIPHFEKMLIDNVWTGSCYLEAYKRYDCDEYKETAREIFEFIARDLYIEGAGFCSSIDADKDGIEGKEFTFSYDELTSLLDEKEMDLVCAHFGVEKNGNFDGRNVLSRRAKSTQLGSAYEKLFAERMKRRSRENDQKILTSINGHAVAAFIKAATILEDPTYFDLAKRVFDFMNVHLISESKISRRYCQGEVKYDGIFDDYAAVIKACLSFYSYTNDSSYLEKAEGLCEVVEELFSLRDGPYSDVSESLTLFFTTCDLIDKREPCGNSVHLKNLLSLYEFTKKKIYLDSAKQIMACSKEHEEEVLTSMHMLSSVIDFLEKKESFC